MTTRRSFLDQGISTSSRRGFIKRTLGFVAATALPWPYPEIGQRADLPFRLLIFTDQGIALAPGLSSVSLIEGIFPEVLYRFDLGLSSVSLIEGIFPELSRIHLEFEQVRHKFEVLGYRFDLESPHGLNLSCDLRLDSAMVAPTIDLLKLIPSRHLPRPA